MIFVCRGVKIPEVERAVSEAFFVSLGLRARDWPLRVSAELLLGEVSDAFMTDSESSRSIGYTEEKEIVNRCSEQLHKIREEDAGKTKDECYDLCTAEPECQVMMYHSEDARCQLTNKTKQLTTGCAEHAAIDEAPNWVISTKNRCAKDRETVGYQVKSYGYWSNPIRNATGDASLHACSKICDAQSSCVGFQLWNFASLPGVCFTYNGSFGSQANSNPVSIVMEKCPEVQPHERTYDQAEFWNATYRLFVLSSRFNDVESQLFDLTDNTTDAFAKLSDSLEDQLSTEGAGLFEYSLINVSVRYTDIYDAEWLAEWMNTTATVTTTTSLTATSTTTTATVMHVLSLLKSNVIYSERTIEFSFNLPAKLDLDALNLTEEERDSPTAVCLAVFETGTREAFGRDPGCDFEDGFDILRIRLNASFTIKVGDSVFIKEGALVPHGNLVYDASSAFNATVESSERVPVSAQVSVNRVSAQACSLVRFSAADSSGFAGRPLAVIWKFGPRTTAPMTDALALVLLKANLDSLLTVFIPPESFSAAVAAVRESEEGSANFSTMDVELELIVELDNWLGFTDTASALVKVDKSTALLPDVTAITPTSVSININEGAKFGISTSSVDLSKCSSSEVATSSTLMDVSVKWQYYSAGAKWGWNSIAWWNLTDANLAPNMVEFPALTFEEDTKHFLRAIVSYSSEIFVDLPSVTINFDLTVKPRPRLVAKIEGPAEAPETCDFVLTTTGSYDEMALPGEAPAFLATWDFKRIKGCTLDIPHSRNRFARDGTGKGGLTLIIKAGTLMPCTYEFSVKIRRPDQSLVLGGADTFFINVTNSTDALPPISLQVPWREGHRVSTGLTPFAFQPVMALVGSSNCSLPDWTWRWALVEEQNVSNATSNATSLKLLGLMNMSLNHSEKGLEVNTTEWPAKLLKSGGRYRYIFLFAKSHETMETFENNFTLALRNGTRETLENNFTFASRQGSPPVEFASSWNLTFMKTDCFVADTPPELGSIVVEPLSGQAASTPFVLAATGWVDDNTAALEYAFYRFPLPGNSTLSLDAAGNLVTYPHDFEVPSIEWEDSESPNYFKSLGGLELRRWADYADARVLSDLICPTGSFFLMVRVRDSLGAETLSHPVLGPFVTEMQAESVAAAVTVLQSTFGSGDANTIFNAVDAVANAKVAADTSTVDSAKLAQDTINALVVASTLLDGTSETMIKMNDVLTSVVRNQNGAQTEQVLTTASDILKDCIEAMMSSKTAANDNSTARAFLGSILAIGDASKDVAENEASDQAADVVAKCTNLTIKLGDAAIREIPIGSSGLLRSLDKDGRGPSMRLSKRTLYHMTVKGFNADGLQLPKRLVMRRLLRRLAGAAPCTKVGINQVEWLKSNPYRWADPSLGVNEYVEPDASIKVLEIRRCEKAFTFTDAKNPMVVDVFIPVKPEDPYAYENRPYCAMWDEVDLKWSTDGVELLDYPTVLAGSGGYHVQCSTRVGGGVYTAFWWLIGLPSTSTTLTGTTTSETSTITSTTSSSTTTSSTLWRCSYEEMPDFQIGNKNWTCTGDRDQLFRAPGETCTCICFANKSMIMELYCNDRLRWLVVSMCPPVPPMPVAIDPPGYEDNNQPLILGFIFSAIAVIGCLYGLVTCYGCKMVVRPDKPIDESENGAETSGKVHPTDDVRTDAIDLYRGDNPAIEADVLSDEQETLAIRDSVIRDAPLASLAYGPVRPQGRMSVSSVSSIVEYEGRHSVSMEAARHVEPAEQHSIEIFEGFDAFDSFSDWTTQITSIPALASARKSRPMRPGASPNKRKTLSVAEGIAAATQVTLPGSPDHTPPTSS